MILPLNLGYEVDMLNILNSIVEELLNDDLTTEELESLAQEISDHDQLVQALQNNPNINFESIELTGSRVDLGL